MSGLNVKLKIFLMLPRPNQRHPLRARLEDQAKERAEDKGKHAKWRAAFEERLAKFEDKLQEQDRRVAVLAASSVNAASPAPAIKEEPVAATTRTRLSSPRRGPPPPPPPPQFSPQER